MNMGVTSSLIVCGLCAAMATAAHSQVSRDEVQKWFDAEFERAQVMPDLGDASIVWREEVWYVPPASELNALRAEVPGHPEHPRRFELIEYERHLNGEPTIREYQTWVRGEKQWRYCFNSQAFSPNGTLSSTPDFYTDSTVTPNVVWQLSAQTLAVAPAGFDDDEVRGIEGSWREFWSHLSLHMFGGISDNRPIRCHPSGVRWDGRTWSVTLSLYEDEERTKVLFAKEVRGVWDAGAGRGFAQAVRIVQSPKKPDSVGEETVFADWRRIGHGPGYLAFKVERTAAHGARDRVFNVKEVRENEPGTFERVTAVPEAGGTDPVRGPATFAGVKDFGSGVERILASGEERPLVLQHRTRGARLWEQGMGWVVAGTLIVAMIAVRVYRGHRLVRPGAVA